MTSLLPAPDAAQTEPAEPAKSDMIRDKPTVDPSRAALVVKWQERVTSAKKHFKDDIDRMKDDQKFLRGAQWEGAEDPDRYTANIIQRHVNQRVAALYAKNPKVKVRKRKTLDFTEWDGTTDALTTIQMAVQQAQATGIPLTPEILSLVEDIQQGITRRKMLEKVSSTLSIVFDYTLNQQLPPFKVQMKQLVRRTCTTGVGYVKLGYERLLERTPADVERVNGLTEKVSVLERIMADKQDGELDESSPEHEELRILLAEMQTSEMQVAKEGLVFDFPTSTSIIIDPACRHLRTFTGARWIAEEHILTPDVVKEIYGIDMKQSGAKSYDPDAKGGSAALKAGLANVIGGGSEKKRDQSGSICVWTIWDKVTSQTCTIADGYEDFLVEPKAPDVFLERFWPVFPLSFNESEDEDSIYPRSDVHLLKPMQREYNRSREGMRQHRIANRPLTAVAAGQLDEDDIEKLKNRPAHAVVTLNSLAPGSDVGKLLQTVNGPNIDANLYDTSAIFEDLLRVVGQSDASIGSAQGGVTATGDSIAEQNRTVSIASNVDDLDDMLNELSRAAGQIMLAELAPETVAKIAGPGAVWPDLSRQDISDELMLEVEAGSSGRPNKAAEVANMERIAPLLLQVPGIRPDWMVRELIRRLDDNIDPTDAIAAGLPSMIAQNAMARGPGAAGAPGEGGADNAEAAPSGPPQQGGPASMPQAGPGGKMNGA